MAVKLRLARHGRKKNAIYYVVAADSRAPRDGKFIEKIGTYNPHMDNVPLSIKADRALYWLMVGAEPTPTTRNILSQAGVMYRKHLQIGVNKGAISQEDADAKFEAWRNDKESKLGHALVSDSGFAATKTKASRIPTEPERPAPVPEAPPVEETDEAEPAPEEAPAAEAPVVEEKSIEAPAEVPAAPAEETPVAEVPAAPVAEAPVVEEKPAEETPVVEEKPAETPAAPEAKAEEAPEKKEADKE